MTLPSAPPPYQAESTASAPAAPAAPRGLGDLAGIAVSVLCAIHCAASTVFVAGLALLRIPGGDSPVLEWAFLIAALALGAGAMRSGKREHGSARPLLWFVLGAVLLSGARLLDESWVETLCVVLGATSLVAGHALNLRLRRNASVCPAPVRVLRRA